MTYIQVRHSSFSLYATYNGVWVPVGACGHPYTKVLLPSTVVVPAQSVTEQVVEVVTVPMDTAELDLDSLVEVETLTAVGGIDDAVITISTAFFHRGTAEDYLTIRSRVRVGVEAKITEGYVEQTYSLFTSALQAVEWSLDNSYALVYPIPEGVLDQQYSLLTLQQAEWCLDQEYGQGVENPTQFAVDFKWAVAGSGLLHEFKALLNNLRQSMGLLPVNVYEGVGPDIAQRHSLHMRQTGIYAHESEGFPAGWRYVPERGSRLHEPVSAVLENLVAPWGPYGVLSTALDIYTAWYNSPPHYANMTADISAGNPNLRFLLGVEYFIEELNGVPAHKWQNNHFSAFTLKIVDLGSGRDLMPVQANIDMAYSVLTPVVERLGMEWATRTYIKVLAGHGSAYSLIVSADHEQNSSVRVGASHAFTTYYTVHASHDLWYEDTEDIGVGFVDYYDIHQYASVVAPHDTSWSLRITKTHQLDLYDSPYVRSAHNMVYDQLNVVIAGHIIRYENSSATVAAHAASYNIIANVFKGHLAGYGDQVPVLVGHEDIYELLLREPVSVRHEAFYSLADDTAVLIAACGCVVSVEGKAIDYSTVNISADEGDASWVMEVYVDLIEDFTDIEKGDSVVIGLYGVDYVGFVDTKNIERSSSTDVSMSITCVSPVSREDAPYAKTRDYLYVNPINAHAAVEDILGQTVDWQILDWVIPPYRFAARGVTPLDAAKIIAKAAGGVVESAPDGSVYVRYLFPVSVPDMATAVPDFVFTDLDDHLTSVDKGPYAEIFNKYRIRGDRGFIADKLEFVPDEGSDDSGVIRAYVEPWRPSLMQVKHTDGSMVSLMPLGVSSREEEEVVEIREGEGSLSFPGVAILSHEWLSVPMGSLYLEPRTTSIKVPGTDVNWGYGLVRIKYRVDSLNYKVQFPIGNIVQFILLDTGG